MAKPNHVELLKVPELLRRWRKRYTRQRLDLVDADLRSLGLNEAPLARANFRWANLSRSSFKNADMSGAHFRRTDVKDTTLTGANLSRAHVTIADFLWAQADGTLWDRAELLRVNFHQASLAGASFKDARVTQSLFVTVDLTGCDFSGMKSGDNVFADCDLSSVRGLESVKHPSGSFVSLDTLARTLDSAGGKFTVDQEAFFVGAGVPKTLLDYLPSILEAEPIQFFSCFISYCDADEAFARRLHHDFRELGIRCWKYDVDALIGRGVWDNIDSAIRLHDKAIVICSRESLQRPGVLREIERALNREDELVRISADEPHTDTDILVPIRLDSHVLRGWRHARKADVTAKHIGDFRGWSDDRAVYAAAFSKLLHSLDPRSRIGISRLSAPPVRPWERMTAPGRPLPNLEGWGWAEKKSALKRRQSSKSSKSKIG
jgi:hypothetical protein